jgi:hypothetical protein
MVTAHVASGGEATAGRDPDGLAAGLAAARAGALALGLPVPPLRGQLLRPQVALSAVHAAGLAPDPGFWLAALAVQLAHEARSSVFRVPCPSRLATASGGSHDASHATAARRVAIERPRLFCGRSASPAG